MEILSDALITLAVIAVICIAIIGYELAHGVKPADMLAKVRALFQRKPE